MEFYFWPGDWKSPRPKLAYHISGPADKLTVKCADYGCKHAHGKVVQDRPDQYAV